MRFKALFFMKRCQTSTFLFAVAFFVFCSLWAANPAQADCEGNWQMFPYQTDRIYNWQGYNGSSVYYYDFDVALDSNGYNYFTSSSTIANLRIYPTSAQMTGTFKTSQNGYKLWIFSTWTTATDNYFRYTDSDNIGRYTTTGTATSTFSVAGRTIYARYWQGFDSSHLSPYSLINIDSPQIYIGSDTRIYALFYTDQDLSYIDTETEFYNFLNDLSYQFCGGGASGTWGTVYPLATASTTPLALCAGIEPSSAFDVVGGVQWGLCNIAQWLFVPSSVSVQNFQSLGTTFEQKAPFAYFYLIKNALNALSASSTPAFTLASTTGALNTSIFQPLKTGLAWILWLIFGVWCIKRIAKFDF